MDNDGYKLKQIQDRNTLFGWLKISATRFFIKKRDRMIEDKSGDALMMKAEKEVFVSDDRKSDARSDFMRVLFRMQNKRYAYVLQMLIINDMDFEELAQKMNITVGNLYNIKKRALAEFTKVALKDIEYYEN